MTADCNGCVDGFEPHGYMYEPDEFSGMMGLSDDLSAFYGMLEAYDKDTSTGNRHLLRMRWEDLFFSIKHREVEGRLNPVIAGEMRDYLGGLAYDRL